MEYKQLFLVVILDVVLLNLVNGHLTLKPDNQALDNSLYEEVIDDELCSEQIDIIRSNPTLTMFFADAGIRIPNGVLQGNTLDMGNYHQCINFNQPLPDSELQGKYCAIRVPLNQNFEIPDLPFPDGPNFGESLLRFENETIRNLREYYVMQRGMKSYTGVINDDRMAPESPLSRLQLTLAACVPRPCTTRHAFDSFLFNVTAVGFEYTDLYCRLPNDKPWTPADYVAIGIFSCIGFLTILSTLYDLWHTYIKKTDPKSLSVVARSFSVYTNGRRLMTFNSGPDAVECIDGIRVLAMAWVLLGHTFTSEFSWSNPLDSFAWSTSWQSLWVVAGHYAVDTFFALSGFLVVFTTVGKLHGKSLLKNLHLFYLNRLLRMFPLLAAAILLEASYLNRMTDGPNWNVVASQVNRCRTAWWQTLLHIQNYAGRGLTCIGQTWYLAIDVQLHILSPIILVWVLWGNKKIAWSALGLGLLGILTASTTYIFIQKFPPVMIAAGRENEFENYMNNYYVNTLTRAPPFVVGMVFGYLVRVSKVKLTRVQAIVFWPCFFGLLGYLIYFNYPINQASWDNQFMSSFYNAFFRSFWAIIIGCLIYACENGFAGPLNWFLSLQVWKIPSRVSYAMYLFHYMLMVAINFTATGPVFFTPGLVTFKFLAHYAFCFAVSFLMTLVIDSPFSTLFKLLLGGGIKKPQKISESIVAAVKEDEKQV